MLTKNIIRKLLREQNESRSNYDAVINNFKGILPQEYSEKIDDVFKIIKEYIQSEGFVLKVLNNCQVPFKGARTKNFIIICSPKSYQNLADFIYVLFHEIRHEIQMGKLKQTNPMSGDIENFDELYEMYWNMELDAHEYGIEWVDKMRNILNLPARYYTLSSFITTYPTMGHYVRNSIEQINRTIKDLKSRGYEYSDLGDLPMIKSIIDKLEDLFD
jgi:hypothetical protein